MVKSTYLKIDCLHNFILTCTLLSALYARAIVENNRCIAETLLFLLCNIIPYTVASVAIFETGSWIFLKAINNDGKSNGQALLNSMKALLNKWLSDIVFDPLGNETLCIFATEFG